MRFNTNIYVIAYLPQYDALDLVYKIPINFCKPKIHLFIT